MLPLLLHERLAFCFYNYFLKLVVKVKRIQDGSRKLTYFNDNCVEHKMIVLE